ncbi:MAG TPA: signal peptide peptidase SppA [Steroidobacteraceae bacterium]|nr:signal peptide peptidase SppA [Steroidobacteraceae bacterium]
MAIGSAILSVFRFIWRALDGLRKVLHLVLLLFLFLILLAMMSTSIPIVPGRAALVLDIQGPIVEQYSGDPLERALGRAAGQIETETRLRDILDAIDAATDDDRIKLIVLDLKDMAGGGLSKLQDVGAALSKFRKGGKKVIATGVYYEQAQYYLAAHADEIYLDPMGLVFMDGYEYYRLFMREAIDKLAIDVNVFKVGTYKSFMEGYTRNDMSPEEREESLAWLGVLWNAYQADVSKARGLQGGALQAYVNDSAALVKGARGDSARVALAQGLVTALKSPADVEEQIKAVVGEDDSTHSFNAVNLESYVAAVHAERRLGRHRGGDVGVVIASGEILDGDQPPGTIGGESAARIIRDARFDDDIRAVVVRVDSPGGSIYASERIYRELKRLREAGKPVIVSMSSTAASGGYYIAAAADEIWAAPTTLTGSIGVFAGIPTFQRTLDKVGLHSDGVGTTKLSGQFRLDRGLGPDARLILQEGVEHAYREFLSRVATSRKKSVEEIDKVAQGRVWAGSAAKERGLVDKLGTLEQAIEAAAVRAGLGEKYDVRFLDPEMTWQEALTMQLRAATASVVERLGFGGRRPELVRKVLDPIEREIQRFARFNDPKNLYSYCFCAPR